MKTIHQIKDAFGSGIARTLNTYAAERDRIQNAPAREYDRKIPGYISDPDERRTHIQRMKEADVKELAERLRREVSPVLEGYPKEVERRREELRKAIFSGQDVSAETLARVATATEEQLGQMYAAAAHSQADDLARIVYAETTRRPNLADLRLRFAEEQGGVYAEWETMPTSTEAEEKVNQQRFILDQHMSPQPRVGAY